MLFNSTEFLFAFLPLALAVFFLLGRWRAGLAVPALALLSVGFYTWWDWHFLPILLLSVTVNYLVGSSMVRWRSQARPILVLGLVANLSALFCYKYLDLFIDTVDALAGLGWPRQHLPLPLGISFFTFTQIAWLVDTYQGKVVERRPVNYLLFVTYFPHLIAGPILHHAQMMPQFANPAILRPQAPQLATGLVFLTVGLVKKVVLADYLASFATPVFEGAAGGITLSAATAWMGVLAYSLQLYFDFSGYCDMAIGISRLFNIDLPVNFNSPYRAVDISDFWRRWHMTLSQFLRDYLYIPLGGNRHGRFRRYLNLMTTMLLGGIWHGAGWTFLIWGGLHGLYLCLQHAYSHTRSRLGLPALPAFAGILLTCLAAVLAWVPFRASDFSSACAIWHSMAGLASQPGGISDLSVKDGFGAVAAGWLLVWALPNSQQGVRLLEHRLGDLSGPFPRAWGTGLLAGLVFSLVVLSLGHVSEFLYFQF